MKKDFTLSLKISSLTHIINSRKSKKKKLNLPFETEIWNKVNIADFDF